MYGICPRFLPSVQQVREIADFLKKSGRLPPEYIARVAMDFIVIV